MIEKKIAVRGHTIHVQVKGEDGLPVIVFLHGFTGATSTWIDVQKYLSGRFQMVAIDLTGHGQTSVPSDVNRYCMEEQLRDLEVVFDALSLTDFTLVGYSMGGRVALGYTLKNSARVRTLILESASPGLKTAEERAARKKVDAQLATRIETEGIHHFVQFWENIPLFETQKSMPIERQNQVREERLSQNEVGLANSLKGIGTGSQPSYWMSLQNLKLPVFLITGEIDQKFVDIAREMTLYLPNVTAQTVKNVGHAIHVENPALFATMVEEHIMALKNLGRQ